MPYILGSGVFPTAPDPGQRSAGDGHAQHVEQLSGELEHFRRQVIEVVIQAFQGALDSVGPLLGSHGALKQHRDKGAQKCQVAAAQRGEPTGRRAR
ncbi:hypothetical protein D3C81_2044350 [compost metagenome]